MSLATCDSLLAIKIKYKTLFKIILDTSDRLPQNRKPFSVDSEILSIVRTDATVAKRSGAAELPLSFIPFSRDLPCYHRKPCAFPKICFCCRRCPPTRHSKDQPHPPSFAKSAPLQRSTRSKNKNLDFLATFFRLGTPFRPCKAKIGSFMANYPRFHTPTRDLKPRNNP